MGDFDGKSVVRPETRYEFRRKINLRNWKVAALACWFISMIFMIFSLFNHEMGCKILIGGALFSQFCVVVCVGAVMLLHEKFI